MYFLRISAAALAISLYVSQLAAQAPKPPTNMPGSSTGTTSGSPTLGGANFPGSSTSTSNSSTSSGSISRALFFSGKVTLQDGSVPNQPVLIERICSGRPHAEAYTDTSGSFSFRLGQEFDMMPDASEAPQRDSGVPSSNTRSSSTSDSQLATCDLRAVLAGYRSELVQLGSRKSMDSPDIGIIVLHPVVPVEGLTMSATSGLAPKEAHRAYDKGIEASRKMKLDTAEDELHKAVEIYPKYAAAWYELGQVLERRSRKDEARYAYAQSIAADSKYINPYEGLYVLDFHETKWQECAEVTEKVMRLDPYDYPAAFYYNAVANLNLKHYVIAEKSARQSIALDTKHENPQGMYVLGVILAQRRDYTGAVESLHAYLKAAPNGEDAPMVRKTLADLDAFMAAKAAAAPASPEK
jgi:tetratricopeptide (TPR) repeat protein